MTPMIDVVFLLIIFFLVSSHLARTEAQLQLPLPEASSGEALDQEALRIVINVTADGKFLLAGRKVHPQDLTATIGTVIKEKGSDVQLRIRADRQVAYGSITPIIRAAAGAGIWNLSFSVIPVE